MDATQTKKTVKITDISPNTNVIRCVARRDMPEYGLKKGQVFMLSRSSEADTFYIVVWSDERSNWTCGHPASPKAKPCTHIRNVSAYCCERAKRAKRQQAPAIHPAIKSIAERGSLNGNRGFSLLKKAS